MKLEDNIKWQNKWAVSDGARETLCLRHYILLFQDTHRLGCVGKRVDIAGMPLARFLIAFFCASADARGGAAISPWQPARQAGEPMTIHVDYDGASRCTARNRHCELRMGVSSSIRVVRRNIRVDSARRRFTGIEAVGPRGNSRRSRMPARGRGRQGSPDRRGRLAERYG